MTDQGTVSLLSYQCPSESTHWVCYSSMRGPATWRLWWASPGILHWRHWIRVVVLGALLAAQAILVLSLKSENPFEDKFRYWYTKLGIIFASESGICPWKKQFLDRSRNIKLVQRLWMAPARLMLLRLSLVRFGNTAKSKASSWAPKPSTWKAKLNDMACGVTGDSQPWTVGRVALWRQGICIG